MEPIEPSMTPFNKERAGDRDYLFDLVGCRVEYAGEPYTVLDVLPEAPQLVLQHLYEQTIQSDRQDRPYRRAPAILCLSVHDEEGQPNALLDLLYLVSSGISG